MGDTVLSSNNGSDMICQEHLDVSHQLFSLICRYSGLAGGGLINNVNTPQ